MMEDTRIYGWEMRIMQCEEDIAMISKRKEEYKKILKSIKEEDE